MNLAETFDQLTIDDINEAIRLEQEEHLQLEFKTVANAELQGGNDKKNLAKCLSGFANSGGGIIVWGVDARKNAQGVDCASSSAATPLLSGAEGVAVSIRLGSNVG
jgi:predicted HTH transcriptional regulator